MSQLVRFKALALVTPTVGVVKGVVRAGFIQVDNLLTRISSKGL
jgi:hypothetical protein